MLRTLDELGLRENTLVIFTSDNGPVLNDGYLDHSAMKVGDHKPAGPWRGGKYSPFEGGTRMPFLVRWPAGIKEGVDCFGFRSGNWKLVENKSDDFLLFDLSKDPAESTNIAGQNPKKVKELSSKLAAIRAEP